MRTAEEELAAWDGDLARRKRRLADLIAERDRLNVQIRNERRAIGQMDMARDSIDLPKGDDSPIAEAVRAAG